MYIHASKHSNNAHSAYKMQVLKSQIKGFSLAPVRRKFCRTPESHRCELDPLELVSSRQLDYTAPTRGNTNLVQHAHQTQQTGR
jgi:hypothetical protein